MESTPRKKRGFTLIELLVVIAIIGLLSTIVLASVNAARDRARIAAIASQALEFRTLMELNYSEYGTYAHLSKNWTGDGSGTYPSCDTQGFSGIYAEKAKEICNSILNSGPGGSKIIMTRSQPTSFPSSSYFSIMARLPDGTLFCVGSSGATSMGVPASTAGYLNPGCYTNP